MPCPRNSLPLLAVLLALLAAPAGAGEVVEFETRPGVTQRMLIETRGGEAAIALLLAGGHGKVGLQPDGAFGGLKGNFLLRAREHFLAKGIGVAILDAPSDRQDKAGLTWGFRMSEDHAADIAKAVRRLRDMAMGTPVWLVGTSRGSTSAANAAARMKPGEVDGVVITSAAAGTGKTGDLLDLDLKSIRVPVLVLHHKADGCASTPAAGAPAIHDALVAAPRKELMLFEGGDSVSDPCQGRSHHGFLGIEEEVVGAIAAWMRTR